MDQQNKSIFILSGQSNMAGRGGVSRHKVWDGVVPPECRPDPSKILRLTAALEWEVANEPLHIDIDSKKTCGVGPGMAFANNVKDIVGIIGLVPCAVGGTAIKEWAKGETLYEDMIKRAEKAAVGGDIKALLWYQGESDATLLKDAEVYKAKMEKFIEDVRSDLHMHSLPIIQVKMEKFIEDVRSDLHVHSLPIIQVAIASGDKYMEVVREAQKAIDLPNVVTIDAKGLELKEDNLHLTTEAQVQLGHMLASAYLSNFESPPPCSS